MAAKIDFPTSSTSSPEVHKCYMFLDNKDWNAVFVTVKAAEQNSESFTDTLHLCSACLSSARLEKHDGGTFLHPNQIETHHLWF